MSTKRKILELLSSIAYTISSNLISLLITLIVILVLPKYIGVEDYGYWQLYMFYGTYIGFMHFGWNDGLYLRFGGANYKDLDKNLFFSQFVMLSASQVLFAFLTILIVNIYLIDLDKQFVIYMTAISMVVTNSRYMLLYILQATYRMKDYSTVTISDRVLFAIFVVILFCCQLFEFEYLLYSDLLARVLSLMYAGYLCKEIVFKNFFNFKFTIREAYENIRVGIKMMFSNIANKLIIGNVRFAIEYAWSIAVFGKISLMLSVSGFMMLFINAISLVLFPFLRRVQKDSLSTIYLSLRNTLMILLLGVLLFYFPLSKLLYYWLPDYRDSLQYLAILFPLCIYEGKMSLLINTYLKVLRKEKTLMSVNFFSLIISLILTVVSVFVIKDLTVAVLSIITVVGIRCLIAEVILSKFLRIKLKGGIVWEAIMVSIFIFATWNLDTKVAFFTYLFLFIIYIVCNKQSIYSTFKFFKLKLVTKT